MEMEVQSFGISQVLKALPENIYPSPVGTKTPKVSVENALIKSIVRDDRAELVEQADNLVKSSEPLDRSDVSRLLHLCCEFDSAESAAALINGEVGGAVPVINEIDDCSGMTPLHTAAENHARRCIEMLLRKRARTDLKTKAAAGSGAGAGHSQHQHQQQLLALELALRCTRMEVDWGPDEPLDDLLLLLLSEKDLSPLRLLAEKTREVGEVAYSIAMEGQAARLAALLMVAGERVNGTVLELRTNDGLAAEKTTVYSCVIREAISIFSGLKQTSRLSESKKHNLGGMERRKLLLREMELLHFFGASPNSGCADKKATSPLILASQAGDEAVIKLLLKTDIDVNEGDAEGNSALHWSLKAWKLSSPEQIRILWLLLKHGARVRQRNMLGLTAVHIAAGNGNLEALEILLSQDPDSVYLTSELKETPLFSAAKNDYIECAQLLLRYGATTDVHNLRRERPIDLAKSQDMRSALSRTSIVIINRTSQQIYTACVHSDEVVSETCEMLLKEADPTYDSMSSSSDGKVCKYYGSPTGCIRGSKCFYRHGEEELNTKSRVAFARSAVLLEFKRKIFVGGLPPTLDSESLGYIMEEQFGPVADARVLEMEIDGQIVSRGFGFVTFKHEKSVAAAVEAHYTNIWGKRVEMKSAIPKCLLSQEEHRDEPRQQTMDQENSQLIRSQAPSPSEKSASDDIGDEMSWADRVAKGQPAQPVNGPKACRPQFAGQKMPVWFNTLQKWLPQFLRKASANSKEGEFYSLSSLKADFKSTFGLELDHASLGYPKLSDFIRSLPELCTIKTVHTGGQVANHMILLPTISCPPPLVIPKNDVFAPYQGKPTHEKSDDGIDSQKLHEDPGPSSNENVSIKRESVGDAHSNKIAQTNVGSATDMNNVYDYMSSRTSSRFGVSPLPDIGRFLQFLEPDPLFLARTWLGNGGFKSPDLHSRPKHLVLEALAQKRKEVFFLRSPMFYNDYAACLKRGTCFACEKNKMLWANYPCQHLLWCGDCKLIAMRVAAVSPSSHKCVLCDHVVEKIDLITRTIMPQHIPSDVEFLLQIHAGNLQSQRLQA